MTLTSMRLKSLLKLSSLLLIAAAMMLPATAEAQARKRGGAKHKATAAAKSNGVGTLFVYYATSYFETDGTNYSPGDYIADNIDPSNYIGSSSASYYILTNEFGMKYNISKSKATVKKYTISQLPISSVGRCATFASDDGCLARIFKSSNNGHHYYDCSDGSILDQYIRPEGCYIFSAEYYDIYYDTNQSENYGKVLFEEEIKTDGDHFKLYSKDVDNARTIGGINLQWRIASEKWPENQSAYDANGNLLTDLFDVPYESNKSIAYIADLDALYFNGKLYYRQKDKAPTMATTTAETNTNNEKVYNSVEYPPKFPGGDAALMKYVATHIQYPTMAQVNNVQGNVVLRFVVEKDGSIGEVRVARSKGDDLDKEAVRMAKTLPNFIPGKQDGKPVRVWYTMPVNFNLQNNNE